MKWTAPEGTEVTILVTGRASAPHIAMTASPAATQGEITSLLAFGRRAAGSTGDQASAEAGATAQTTAIVEGMTAAVLGRQLSRTLPASVSFSVRPGRDGLLDAEVAGGYQRGELYFELGYRPGGGSGSVDTLGQSQSRTTFEVEWRFLPKWSVVTTLGDTGSALVDLLYIYRY